LAAAPWIGLPKFTSPSFHADAMSCRPTSLPGMMPATTNG
jgi:hypothetical protein